MIREEDDVFALHETFGPGSIEIGRGMRGDDLMKGLAPLLELFDAARDGAEHLDIQLEFGEGAEFAVAGDDFCLGVGQSDTAIDTCDHAVDGATGANVNEGIVAVEP